MTYVVDRFKLISIPGDIYFISHLPVKIDPVDLLTVLACHRGDLVPRHGVSRLAGGAAGPVEAIRHE